MEKNKINKKLLIFAGIIFLVVMLSGIAYIRTVGKTNKTEKDLELANKYLDELEYEQAIAIYEEVLSIDPANREALVGQTKAYTGVAGTRDGYETGIQDLEQAAVFAEQAYALYPEDVEVQTVVVETYFAAGDLCAGNGRYEEAAEYYGKITALELDESLKARQEEAKEKIEEVKELQEEERKKQEEAERNQQYEELLKPVLEAWQSGDMEAVKALIYQDEYKKMAGTLGEGESYYYGEYDEEGNRDGVGVAVYLIPYYDSEYPCYYLGNWKSGMREGEANWVEYAENIHDCCNWESRWENDMPNGPVKMYRDYENSDLMVDEGRIYYLEGNVINGLFDGEVTDKRLDGDGSVVTIIYRFTSGYVNVMRVNDNSFEYPYVIGRTVDGNGEHVVDKEYIDATHGMLGYGEWWF